MLNEKGSLAELSRRKALQAIGLSAAILGGAGLVAGCGGSSSTNEIGNRGTSDIDILNFLLNFEYLLAEFYTYSTTGQGIEQFGIGVSGVGAPGQTLGGQRISFADQRGKDIASEIAADERSNVRLLRNTLGAKAIARPTINLAAQGVGFLGEPGYLGLARAFEDVIVSAYGELLRLLIDKELVRLATGMIAAEAMHTGNIRYQIALRGIDTSSVDGRDILPPPSGRDYFSLDPNGLSAMRTTREVLNILYDSTSGRGGFFPNGFNGAIVM